MATEICSIRLDPRARWGPDGFQLSRQTWETVVVVVKTVMDECDDRDNIDI